MSLLHPDSGVIELVFWDDDAYEAALRTWTTGSGSQASTFALVTAHPTCNPDDDRGVYLCVSDLFWCVFSR